MLCAALRARMLRRASESLKTAKKYFLVSTKSECRDMLFCLFQVHVFMYVFLAIIKIRKTRTIMSVSSRKRWSSIAHKACTASKKQCMDADAITNEDPGFSSDLQDESRQNELHSTCETKQYIPDDLIRLMYRLDLSVLCSLRKLMHKDKYPSLSLTFKHSEIDQFNHIVLRYKKKSIYIQTESVDKYYINSDINFARLFTKEKRSFSVNSYFNSFVKYLISKSGTLSENIEYLIVYTNSGLDITEEKSIKGGHFKNFCCIKFDSINMEECDVLNDFLFTRDNTQGSGFYQFSRDKKVREELFKRLEFSCAMQKVREERNLSQEYEKKIKEAFLDKLVFAVNQPNREKLNSIIKTEIERHDIFEDDYTALQEKVLHDLTVVERDKKLENYVSGIIYQFNLLILFMHDIFLHRYIHSINFEAKRQNISNTIALSYKDKTTYVMAHSTNSNIGYSDLFPSRHQKKKNVLPIDKLFTFFVEELREGIKYFIIYTNADIDFTEEKKLKKGRSKDFYPLKFDSKKIFKDCLYINRNSLFRFAQEEATRKKLASLLKLPFSLQKANENETLSNESEQEIKEKFLNKLIFATNQPNREELSFIIKDEINKSDVPYTYEELYEIGLRWAESHELGHITEGVITKLFADIKNNRSSSREIPHKNINEEIRFAKSVVGKGGTLAFDQYLNFLIKGEGTKCLEILQKDGINLTNMSSILGGAGAKAPKTFKDLYDLWFDVEGNKTRYLKSLEEKGINLGNMSSILNGARSNAPKAFKDLYDLWFDVDGNKTQYLKTLEKERINLSNMSSILNGTGAKAPKAFKELYDLWFDVEGNKTQYLKTLEEKGISLSNMSSILSRTGTNAPKAFKSLYDLWFDIEGNKTQYLKALEDKGVNLSNISSILNGAGVKAPRAFKDLYDLWFDMEGRKTPYLRTLKREGIDLVHMSSILHGAGSNAPKAFKDLYDLWFDANGKKTEYLTVLEKQQINLSNVSSILGAAGVKAPKAFKDLCGVWFDAEGNKTQCLKNLEKERINLANMSGILHGAGSNASKAFKDLYDLWFDAEGNKTQYLKILEKNQIGLVNISNILNGVGSNAPKAFKELHNAFFDERGKKRQYLKHFINGKNAKETFTIHNLSGILGGAGANAKIAIAKLHNVCFNDKGKRREILDDFYNAGFKPGNLSSVLCGSGARAALNLKQFHQLCFDEKRKKTKLLNDFCKAGFRPRDLCAMLAGAADSAKTAHHFCFIGETKKYLYHFWKGGFTPQNLSRVLHGAKANICSALTNFHDVCFDEAGHRTKLLYDFFRAGFMPSDLSNILSMAGNNAACIFRNFHKLCFNEDNYLDHFFGGKELFTPKGLSKMLHRAGMNICTIFGRLHNLCFDSSGHTTRYLNSLIRNKSNEMFGILYEKVRGGPFNFVDDIYLPQQNVSRTRKIKQEVID